jgi:NTE family protein
VASSRLDKLFAAHGEAIVLLGGEVLHSVGEHAHALFRLVSGRLALTEPTSGGGSRLLGVRRPGEVVGAGALLAGIPHKSTATALRDSELLRVPRATVEDAVADDSLYAELAREALAWAAEPRLTPAHKAAILGFVAVCDSVPMRAFVEDFAAEMRRLGLRVAVLGGDSLGVSAATLSQLEDDNDFLLMAAEKAEVEYTHFSGRQIDRLILVGRAASALPQGPFQFAAVAILRHRLLDIVLIQPADCRLPHGSARWMAAAPAARLFHVREGSIADIARLARGFGGRSVGLALSGGGARAYAHVGVIRALTELGVPIDFLSGTSMGAVIGAGFAMGWSLDELDRRIRAAFVKSSPLADIAFPLVAMSRGGRVDTRLKEHFGDTDIADLWRPFTCVSTDLTTGEMRVHRSGLVHRALRASISLPGVLPPVVEAGHVLVDGTLVRVLPVDLVQELHDGPTIGVDVAEAAGLTPYDLKLHPSGLRWLLSGAWRRGPPIVSVLIRSAIMPTARAMAATRDRADLLIEPDLDGIELRDWKAYDRAVAAGHRAAMARAEELSEYVR